MNNIITKKTSWVYKNKDELKALVFHALDELCEDEHYVNIEKVWIKNISKTDCPNEYI